MSAGTSQRKIRNYVINPQFQSRMSFYFVTIVVALLGFMILFLYTEMTSLRTLVTNISGVPIDTIQQVEESISGVIVTSLFFFLIAIMVVIFYGIIISHRIAGPMYAILKYIEDLKSGNFSSERKLRPYDELSPIMDALHDLAGKLNKKG